MAQPLVPRTLGNASTPKVARPTLPEAPLAPDPIDHDSLNAAAQTLLSQLPRYVADSVRETAAIHTRVPLWAMVAGHLLKTYENGDMHAPLLDPSWPHSFPAGVVDPNVREYICERDACRKPFTPKRYKERYCSQTCGALAQADLDAAAAADYVAKQEARRAEWVATKTQAGAAIA